MTEQDRRAWAWDEKAPTVRNGWIWNEKGEYWELWKDGRVVERWFTRWK